MQDKCYRLIIFDWDGTLMDSERRIVDAIQHAAREVGLPVLSDRESASIIGLSLTRAIEQLYPAATPEQVERMAAAYSRYFLLESSIPMRPFDGAEALLKSLKQAGARLAIATGKSRRGLDQILPESGLAPYFDTTRTPVEAASKPDPLMLAQILEELNVPVDEALMVGDTTFDLEMARNIGMDRVAVSFGVHEHAELDAFEPLAHFHSLEALRQWLLPRICQGNG